MNFKMVFHTIGNILKAESVLLLLPLIVSLIYKETIFYAYLIPSAISLILGLLLSLIKADNNSLYAKEGFTIVGLSWILLSLIGALPFVISKDIPSFIDALFETTSGFTTTGASILSDVEVLNKSSLFYRSFTHWIGGMGVLVFILAIMPKSEGRNIYIMQAESTGPTVGKLVSKVKSTARILYLIYLGLTVLEMIFLLCGGMPVFDSIVNSFATAGTGGFSVFNANFADPSFIPFTNAYCQVVIAIFMILFGINFNIFYLILIGHFAQAFKNEELLVYLGIILVSIVAIATSVYLSMDITVGKSLRDSLFQVASIITTTGFATVDFASTWPMIAKMILILLMFIGGCAGSTGGGIKVIRIIILLKSSKREIHRLSHPNTIENIRVDGNTIDETVVSNVKSYFGILIAIFAISVLLLSFNGFDFETTITAVIACLNNIGPGLGLVGPAGNFSMFNIFSKVVLILDMLIGRLEILPILVLLSPKTWIKK